EELVPGEMLWKVLEYFSIGEHTYPLPPPSHISESIKDCIKLIINNASEYLDYITPWKIISSN
ncbi:26125_t:CDS:2, partial [Gigaspora margarita]